MMRVWDKSELKNFKLTDLSKISLKIETVLDSNKLEKNRKEKINLLILFIILNKSRVALILLCHDQYFINIL